MKSILLSFILLLYYTAEAQVICTFAGNDTGSLVCNACPATATILFMPQCARPDSSGNVFIADQGANDVRMVNTAGIIYTIAGNGVINHAGDGGQATDASICRPSGVAFDLTGNLFIVEDVDSSGNGPWVRKVNIAGIITTFAGCGINGYSGDGGPALAAGFVGGLMDIAVDRTGNIYIMDPRDERIRKINPDGIISTCAGNGTSGFSGDGGPATSAQVNNPCAICTDSIGNLYIADYGNNRLRKVTTDGIISTIAGNGGPGSGGDGNPATIAALGTPDGVAIDRSGNIYVSEFNRYRVRKISPNDTITTIAGGGISGYSGDGGSATAALLSAPSGVGVDSKGNIYVSDPGNANVRKIFMDSTSRLSVPGISELQPLVHIMPNPNRGAFILTLKTGLTCQAKVSITDMIGRVVKETYITTNKETQLMLDAPSGIYLLSTQTPNQRCFTKIVIE
jgi:hypothetical protein